MKQWIGYVLLAICLVITYQGWRNSQVDAATEGLARSVACEAGGDGCTLSGHTPRVVKTNFFGHQYEFPTSAGPITVTCSRSMMFFGQWECAALKGTLVEG